MTKPGLLDDSQKKECRRMLEQIAARVAASKENKCQAPVILGSERMTLRRCWERGALIVAELNTIRAVHGRMRGVKTPEEYVKLDMSVFGGKKNG